MLTNPFIPYKLKNDVVTDVWFYKFQGHINAGSPEVALTLHEEMLDLGLDPDRLTYNTLIFACVKIEKLDVAMSFYEQLKVSSMCLKGQFCASKYFSVVSELDWFT